MNYTKLGKHTVNAVRLAEVLQVMARHGLAGLLRRAGVFESLPARVLRGLNLLSEAEIEPSSFGQRLGAAFMDLGPTFVKFGQIMSTRPDLIRNDIANDLSNLQDKVDPLPFETMEALLEKELGAPPDELYATFDKKPVASASLSQVYRATLRTGEPVAVKVQRPGIEKVIESDISLMEQVAEWVDTHVEDVNWLDAPSIVNEFARSIRRELDFSIEARVIEQFRKNFQDMEQVFSPRLYPELSTRRVLTIDWVDGVRVDKLEEYEARNCDPKVIAELGCKTVCMMVFEHHLFHADPHPGNIFVTRNNQIAFLDFGMAGHIERTDVAAIADLFLAMFQQDSLECVEAVLTLTTGDPDDRDSFEHEIADFFAFEARSIVGGGHVARGIERATQILRRHGLELAPRFSLLLKALATIETVARKLDPKIDMVPIFRPYVGRMIRARYQPKQVAKETRRNINAFLKLSRQIPGDLSHILRQFRRGRFQFQVHHEHLENLAGTIDRASSRITAGMIIGALIVGSSLLISTDSSVRYVGISGYVLAGVLGFGLVVSMLWSKRF